MAQLNITLNQEEILQLLSQNSGDAFRESIGRLTLHVPRHGNQSFKTMAFDNYSRSDEALIAGTTDMVINRVST